MNGQLFNKVEIIVTNGEMFTNFGFWTRFRQTVKGFDETIFAQNN